MIIIGAIKEFGRGKVYSIYEIVMIADKSAMQI